MARLKVGPRFEMQCAVSRFCASSAVSSHLSWSPRRERKHDRGDSTTTSQGSGHDGTTRPPLAGGHDDLDVVRRTWPAAPADHPPPRHPPSPRVRRGGGAGAPPPGPPPSAPPVPRRPFPPPYTTPTGRGPP